MTKLGDALKRKFKTPEAALKALGLDESVLKDVMVGDKKLALDARQRFRFTDKSGDTDEITAETKEEAIKKYNQANTDNPYKKVVQVSGRMQMDSRKELNMSKKVILTRKAAMLQGALVGFLKPRIAKDAKLDFGKLLGSVTHKNFSAKKGSIVAGIKEQTRGKLAKDANVDGLVTLLDALEDIESPEAGTEDALETDPNSGTPIMAKHTDEEDESMDADPHAGLKDYLKGKGMGDDDIEGACNAVSDAALGSKEAAEEGEDEDMDAEDEEADEIKGELKGGKDKKVGKDKKGAKDEPPPFKGKPEVGGGKAMSTDQVNKAITTATDAAIKQVRLDAAQTRDAERFVRPWVGDLAMAHDSAEAVFRTALTALGVDVKGLHPSAYKPVLERIPQPGKRQAQDESLGMDSSSASDFASRYPGAAKIGFA